MRRTPPNTHSEKVPIWFDGNLAVKGGFVCGDIILTVWVTSEPSDPYVGSYVSDAEIHTCDLDLIEDDGEVLRQVGEDEVEILLPYTLVEYAERSMW